jgi:parallel beta-helix repeat protein
MGKNTIRFTGENGKKISLLAFPLRSVVLQGINTNGCNCLRIEGFQITNQNTTWDKKVGIFLNNNNVEIINNHFYDLRYYPAIRAGSGCISIFIKDNLIERCNMGIWCGGSNWLVEGNTIRRLIRGDAGDDADYVRVFGEDHRFIGNRFYGTDFSEIGQSHVDGFQSFSIGGESQYARNILIENNIVMDFHQGIMLRDTTCEGVEEAVSKTHTNWTVINNVFARGRSYGVKITRVDGVRFINNTLYDMTLYGICISYCRNAKILNNIVKKSYHPLALNANYGGYEEDYNIIDEWRAYKVNGAKGTHDQVGVDPLLLDPENEDFRLMEGSPAIIMV